MAHSPTPARYAGRLAPGLAVVLAAALALVGVAAAPAQAETVSVRDARGDVTSPNDVLRTWVANGHRIGVRIQHRDLRRTALDIQFALRTASGRTWTVYATLDGKNTIVFDQGLEPRECRGVRVARSLRHDWSALSVPRSCVGSPRGRVQVRPRVQWNKSGTHGDWSVNADAHWTRWVPRTAR